MITSYIYERRLDGAVLERHARPLVEGLPAEGYNSTRKLQKALNDQKLRLTQALLYGTLSIEAHG